MGDIIVAFFVGLYVGTGIGALIACRAALKGIKKAARRDP